MNKLMVSAALAALVMGGSLGASAKDQSEQMRDVGSFHEVRLKGSMDVDIKVGGEQSVKVIADSDIIDKVTTEVFGGKLEIGMERGSYHNIKVMRLEITVPSLDAAGIYGSGDMDITGATSDSFELDIKGSGDAVLRGGKFGKFEIDLAGSGDVDASGTCEAIDVDLAGSGDVDADKLECKSADVSLRGSGDVQVYASKSADISIMGSGDVVVSGKPDQVKSRVRGSGDIVVR
ncbi:MAG: DUF2807 domain-containing protein [Alphaproteobacteria bacterium]|nr:MAG: DUF2807 domain-containing protein [Alphaproteobacteria bacterium]